MIEDAKIKEWFYKSKDHEKNTIARILGVEYAHVKLENEDDMYFTKYGLSFLENLQPENFWTDEQWFNKNSIRLSGTSTVYRVKTKEVNGKHADIVVKWNRMGQDIPGKEEDGVLSNVEFNSPFEEFSLVMELKNEIIKSGYSSEEIFVQIPLAIYVPLKPNELWQLGRRKYKMQGKMQSHKDIILDMYRSYAVIYQWIQGIDAVQANNEGFLSKKIMKKLTSEAEEKIKKIGFLVRDKKPHHIIVKPLENNDLLQTDKNKIRYGLIDFELLQKTSEKKEAVRKAKRADYHKRQRDRFAIDTSKKFHPQLKHMNIFDVEYVFGKVESTKGRLWVVGKDPYLFDYFLPERWEKTNKTKISMFSESYYTVTKDDIHIVWEVSKVGLRPDVDPFKKDEKKILEHGFNSPFEEVALALELSKKGIATIYPRAIYMTGDKTKFSSEIFDNSRYESHTDYMAPDNIPILKEKRYYIIIWGYWNGPDEKIADKDDDFYEGINALTAYRDGVITEKQYLNLLQLTKKRLIKVGIKDLNLRGDHLLISFDSKGNLVTNSRGNPEIRICNFEFLKKIE